MFTAGTSEGSPEQRNKGGWYPRIHWKRVSPVVDNLREFWAYSIHIRKWPVLVLVAVEPQVPTNFLDLSLSLAIS